ncbi:MULTISPECIES: CDP-diacylglycerol--glycerol-3-phosphate 3-phosphatidyltransferase [Fusobacterium]|jgi:CDP-diacylglycerol--glycerol-3-phosphate 3-phosphatidyltransferase|uniref:CDP-diacylglycerol--glycerol-3-phosphate 3-phosphatidyltransferase n=1 Tax=Fusobacterium varium ATCC 27725 TaxID=469618 RepID=A0ABN5JIM4_FUSVA|nr:MULTISPECIES: CDP-diacylglycerol--glycerol-3-phosphate 3-phosphatidyltransferase [Fusobacterium]MCD7980227.1 CDP-diacylglycerol--glycerol-3-phosphate 3-phosphatidyltransferase [Fusobacterium sp.]AVQ31445.1 CDP-diacylglycerol--glycerol-3-phosphate 3-phosphatidyltransferase [Fusobacterium varium ATCC 27725]EES62774.1 CDP-diacylglycerol--glycerol-3-phosphate 3-phosphatidyltransferase [Fusobacterium varium ATCC 27725]MCF0170418.1 CDP-diacylglycerol--glycerol-3-phosphate 3-phosphatidyltransferase
MNLPNKLTFIRLVLAVPFIYFLQESNAEGFVYRMIAFALFVVASLTDFFDGYLARKYNLVTDFGKLMDPLADKILVISALVLFVELRYIPAWMSIIVIAREFLISGIRMLAAAKGEVIPAGKLGKYKTTSQMIVILIMIVVGNQWYNYYLMLIPIILTLWSGWEYTSKAKHYFMNSK